MNATVTRSDLDQARIAEAFEMISASEAPTSRAAAMCFALEALARTDEVLDEAAEALTVIAGQMKSYLDEIEHIRGAAFRALHPIVHSHPA